MSRKNNLLSVRGDWRRKDFLLLKLMLIATLSWIFVGCVSGGEHAVNEEGRCAGLPRVAVGCRWYENAAGECEQRCPPFCFESMRGGIAGDIQSTFDAVGLPWSRGGVPECNWCECSGRFPMESYVCTEGQCAGSCSGRGFCGCSGECEPIMDTSSGMLCECPDEGVCCEECHPTIGDYTGEFTGRVGDALFVGCVNTGQCEETQVSCPPGCAVILNESGCPTCDPACEESSDGGMMDDSMTDGGVPEGGAD